ncbi:N,N-dimethylformamidase beta subunit family domain-containing protein [Streptomyces orinoci]|uniref:N,N-dimethylformamidase beta subunit family domain-containing protein n=1 Tax=Streptomyces orinoci TaxID=67339 RepID=A0ABV3K239_STRON|nr:N,N-dimethylformamidase beta subunit family domain-containing protein [Streptomyces orinoci]
MPKCREGADADRAPGPARIAGFAGEAAVAPGECLDLRVTTEPPQPFTVHIHRVGHYPGHPTAEVAVSPRLPGLAQPEPLVAGRTAACHHWWLSWRLRIPRDWRPGAYLAELRAADGQRGYVPFTVRDGGPGDLLLVLPDLSWQAANAYPEAGGPGHEPPATLSLDRPYAGDGRPAGLAAVHDFIRWAERLGYDLAYAHGHDLHSGRIDPGRYRGLVFPGCHTYWTAPMRQAVEQARDVGTSLVFLSAGTLNRRAELAPSPAGPDRLLVRRGRRPLWRDAGLPEQQLLGIQSAGRVPAPAPLVVRNSGHWLWEGTGTAEGEELPGLVTGEADRYHPRTALPPHTERVLLAHSPYRDAKGTRRHQETSLYRAPGGALVFAAGTHGWTRALDRPGHADPRIQRATANLLDHICKRV